MTGGLDGSSKETERLMSERKTQETRPQEQSETQPRSRVRVSKSTQNIFW